MDIDADTRRRMCPCRVMRLSRMRTCHRVGWIGRLVVACCGLGLASHAAAQEARRWLSPTLGEVTFEARTSAEARFQGDVSRQDSELEMSLYDFALSGPIVQDAAFEWSWHARFGGMDMETDALLPDTLERLPDSLWNVAVGSTYRRRLDNGWLAGGDVTIGSAGDRLFASGEEVTARGSAFVRIPIDERHAWVFLLNVANDREYAQWIPLPGVGWQFERDTVWGMLGAPLTYVEYQPLSRVTLSARYVLPRAVKTRVSYDVSDVWRLYTGFEWDRRTFFRHDRDDHDDRLFYYEKRVLAGVRWRLHERADVDLAAGYAFDRLFFEGEDYDDRSHNRLDLSDTPILRMEFRLRF